MKIYQILSVAALFILLFTTTESYSQAGHQKTTVGLYIGPNFSNIDISSPELTAKERSGYQAGFYMRGGHLLYGQAGLQYQVLNSNFSLQDSGINGNVKFKRVQLPLYGGLNLIPILKSVFNIRAYAGPVISYDLDIPNNPLDFAPSDFNRFRIDGTLGAGVDVLIFSLDAGYTLGINNLFHHDYDGKGNYAFVNVGLKF